MDERLKQLIEELGAAISASLADSPRIASALEELKREGYDVFLVLEATIGLNHRVAEEFEELETELEWQGEEPSSEPPKIEWTPQDQKFLRALKIAVD